jgi:hypothetical protein
MAKLLLRSPQYKTVSSGASAKLTITIDGTLRYTIIKNAINSRVVFEISELCRDYIEHSFTQSNSSETITITTQRFSYTEANGGGTETSLDPTPVTDIGYDGYGLFTGSVNPTIESVTGTTLGTALQTNTDIYLPPSTASYIPVSYGDTKFETSALATDGTKYYVGSPLRTFTIHTICDPKFGSSKITFLNRFGALQEMYFFHKSSEDITTTSESYKRNIFDYANTNYSSTDHQMQKFNTNATKKTTLNTPFVTEQFNEAIEELMLSEYVWLTQGSITHPVTPSTKSLRFKTSVNDKLVQYTIEFDHTSSVINNVR